MKNSKLITSSLINSLGVLIYTSAVAWIMSHGEKIFGNNQTFWMPVALLLLFVLSATITGALVLGKPIIFYLEDQKKDAVKLLAYTVGWLFIFTLIIFTVLALLK